MTAEIINLRKARKAKARADREAQAAGNRAKFGRTKTQRLNDEQEKSRHKNVTDGKKLRSDADEGSSQ